MEKKKLLLVAISVGVFLMIAISASLMLFSPRQDTASRQSAVTPQFSDVRPELPGFFLDTPEFAELQDTVEFPDNTQVQDFSAQPGETRLATNGVQFSDPATVQPPARQTETRNATVTPGTITVPPPRSVAVPDGPVVAASGAAPAVVQPRPAVQPAAAQPAAVQSAPAATRTPAATPPATTATRTETRAPAVSVAPGTRAQLDYWIQTGAFSTMVSAEGVKETLADKGITSIIDTSNINGRTLYRVRVGPYTTESEAKYWLALVQANEGFGDSQVRVSPRRDS